MELVKLTKKDTPQIISLDAAAFGPDYDVPPISEKELIEIFGNGFVLGIKDGEHIASNIQVLKKDGGWHIYGIATSPQGQGQGLADRLLKQVISLAEGENVERLTATVRPANLKSMNLFLKNGFAKTALVKDYFGKGKDRFIMERHILVRPAKPLY